nr:MAG TPA: hypothetical protein [Caudoviricetes sp.]
MINITLQLPIYLIKYMRTLYSEPYVPKSDDEMGIYILNILQRKTNVSEYQYRERKDTLHPYQLSISMSCYEKQGCIIPTDKNALIVKFVDSHFRKELFRNAVLNNHYYCIPYRTSILNSLQAYNITESELSYETIRKDFNRKKNEIEKRLLKQ